jgi:hypothetical protein
MDEHEGKRLVDEIETDDFRILSRTPSTSQGISALDEHKAVDA